MKKLTIVLLSCLFSSSLIAQNFEEIEGGEPFEWVSEGSVAFADIDNDGDQDVLITGATGGMYGNPITKLYTNDGDGSFTEDASSSFDRVAFSSIAFADVDNDQDQDMLITGSNGSGQNIAKLYSNDGNGNFTMSIGTPFEGVWESSIAFADVDNDQDQDVLITGSNHYGQRFAKLYVNDGNGVFTEVIDTPFEGVEYSSIAFADIDSDNDKDVLITGATGNYPDYNPIAKLYTNDGNGNFTESIGTPFEGVWESSIAFADVDNDQDQDVLITGETGNYPNFNRITKLYINDGSGIFTEVTDTPFDVVYAGSIAFADIDNDGDQDVLITGEIDYPDYDRIAKLYTNDGNGNFSEVIGTLFTGVFLSSIAFADVDNDNDQDVLITGSSEDGRISKLYRNLSPVGIDEIDLFNNVSIYPNPHTGLVNIDLGSLSNVSIKVHNLSGQLIYYKENINSPIYQFELDAAPGIYILELSAKGEKQQFKLVKQ